MRIGIDLGGTKIEGLLLDDTGNEQARIRTATPKGNYNDTLEAIINLVLTLEKQTGALNKCSVGIGIPGSISFATSLIKNANSTCLIGKALDKALSRALKRPVRIANDANCFTVSEATDGAAAGKSVVFGVILGTGVGGGIVIKGKALEGINGIAGEWGHNPLPWPSKRELPGPNCYCGLKGCIETYLSGPGLAADYKQESGENYDVKDIANLHNSEAEVVLQRYETRLAKALASVINILDPDAIVLGGGLSNISRLYKNVPYLWSEWVFSDRVDTALLENKHGDSSGVRGAARL